MLSGTNSVNGMYSCKRGDPDDSFASERHRQSKLEKVEMEIARLMERNNGQIFIVKHERHNFSKDGGNKYDDYSHGGGSCTEYGYDKKSYQNWKERPIFKIKMKPRNCCKLHQEVVNHDRKESSKRELKAYFKI